MSTVFVRAANPIWYFVDLQGLGLNDEYYIFFLNNDTLLPQAVYETPDSSTPWPNPLQFHPNGTLPDNLYFNNTEVYRLIIRHGNLNTDPLIYEIDNFVPGNESIQPESFSQPTDNQISNPQFFIVNFTSPLTITTAGTYSIAPGWDLILTGPGTNATVSLVPLSGMDQQINNPPFYLRIATTDFTTAVLRQRLNNNGGIWSTTPAKQAGAVMGSITAEAEVNPYTISMNYTPSTGAPVQIITPDSIGTSVFEVAEGSVLIPASTNSDLNNVAFVDINIVLQGTGIIRLSNIQIIGQTLPDGSPAPTPLPYEQQTIEQGINNLFYYYKNQLTKMQIPSYLVGWDFSLNPAQFAGDSITPLSTGVGNKSYYIWDQTIAFQSTNTSFSVSRDPSGALALTAALNTQLAIIQYLDGNQVREILQNRMAVNILGTSFGQNITCTVSLWYTTGATLPSVTIANFNSIVASLDANGHPATTNPCTSPGPIMVPWTEITRPSLPTVNAQFTMTPTNNFVDFNFSGFDATANIDIDSATYFAIVIGTSTITAGNVIYFDSVSLMPGDIATRPAPKTFGETLSDCQYYFEKSYDSHVPLPPIGGTTANCAQFAGYACSRVGAGPITLITQLDSIQILYNQKRTNPTIIIYNPQTGATNSFGLLIFEDQQGQPNPVGTIYGSSSFVFNDGGTPSAYFATNNSSTIATGWRPSGLNPQFNITNPGPTGTLVPYIEFHYAVDARLGVV